MLHNIIHSNICPAIYAKWENIPLRVKYEIYLNCNARTDLMNINETPHEKAYNSKYANTDNMQVVLLPVCSEPLLLVLNIPRGRFVK